MREISLNKMGEVWYGVLEAVLDEARAVELPVLGDARPQSVERFHGQVTWIWVWNLVSLQWQF